MPGMDGLDFLRKVRKNDIDSPFIMFTGRGREEVAVKALKLGANNYIQKGGDPSVQFKLLADVIDQEVRLYKGEKARSNLISIVESSQNAIISKDLDGYITSWNKGAEKIYGYPEKKMIGEHISKIAPDDKKEEIDEIIRDIRKGETVKPFETIRKTKQRKKIHVSLTVSPIKNNEGETIGASSIAQDISDKKLAEKRIVHLNQVLNSIRNVNQIIIREKDKESLINKICKILTDNSGYNFSWIVLLDEDNELSLISHSSVDEKEMNFLDDIQTDDLPDCIFLTLENKGVTRFNNQICDRCRYYQRCEKDKILSVRLEYEDKIYGVLTVSLPEKYAKDVEEMGLLEEVAGDISFSFHNIDMEEKIEKEERKSRRIIDSMLDGFVIFDDEGGQTYVNDAFCNMTGYSREELMGKNFPYPYLGETNGDGINYMLDNIKNDRFHDQEIYLKRKDRSEFPVIVSPEAIKNDLGDYVNYFASIKDISERKKAEDELRNLNKRLEVLFSNIPGMAYRCKNDRNWTMELVSKGSYGLTGYSAEELIGNRDISYGEVIHPDYREYVWTSVNKSIEVKKPFKVIYKIIDKSGEERWVWEQGRAIYSEEDDLEALEGLIIDITERKELEDRQKFLHTLLRHDIKNKVNVVHGYLQLMEDKFDDDGMIKKTIDETKKEIDLIEKVRTLNRIGKETIRPVKLDMILDKIISEYRPNGLEEGIDIRYERSGLEVQGGVLLEDLLVNLVENAIKHSECDLIKISVDDSVEEAVIKIEDNGKGIENKFKDRLFDKSFSIGEKSGSGLGTYLAKEIVEDYGGRIEIDDSEMGGARFDVHLKKV